MRIDRNRLVAATDARTTLPALLDAAVDGRTTHILRDRAVVAHLVPADALVVTPDVEEMLRLSVAEAEAAYFADEIMISGYRNVGDGIGKVLAWAWDAGPDTAVRWFEGYLHALDGLLDDRRIALPAFDPLWRAVWVGMRGFAHDGPIRDFEAVVRELLVGQRFSAAEMAGAGRERGVDDPWPDMTRSGGWAKRRWRDIEVGTFVPDLAGAYEFGSDDDWCRVEAVGDGAVTLFRSDGAQASWPIDATAWVPFRLREPFGFGMERRGG